MVVSFAKRGHLTDLPVVLGWVVVVAGWSAVFATYWDEAWHTDVGRDSAWAAPHVLLYGSVAVVGAAVAGWGLRVLRGLGTLRGVLAQPPLVAAGLGGLGALVAAPIDAAWHAAYGRDAVLFSPPHMLVVLASTALVLGTLAGLPGDARAVRGAAGVLLMANALAVVFEYEADVPQFSERLYLPLLLVTGLAAGFLVGRVVPGRIPVTTVVLGYAALRLVIASVLVALGRSAPDLPIAVLGLAALDLRLRRGTEVLAAIAAVSILALTASVSGLASPQATDVAVVAVPLIVVCGVVALVLARATPVVLVPLVLVLSAAGALVPTDPAHAHDPGQGTSVARAEMTVETDASGHVALEVRVGGRCDDLAPRSIVARRAGSAVTSRLNATADCTYRGELSLPREGRWFVYASFKRSESSVEGWVPVDVGSSGSFRRARTLYVPAGQGVGVDAGQVAAGGAVYLLGFGLLALGVGALRRHWHEGLRSHP